MLGRGEGAGDELMIQFDAIYTIWLREIKRFLRAKSRVVNSIAMPLLWLVFFGVGFTTSFRFPQLATSYLEFLAPGVVAIAILFSSVFAGVSVLWDKQFGFLKEILVAPISRFSIVLGKTFGGVTTSVMQGIIMLFITLLIVQKVPTLPLILASIGVMILISMAFVSFGVAVASKFEDPHGFQVIMNFLVMPMFFLSGAFFPMTRVPGWMQIAMYINPLTYGVDALRGVIIAQNSLPLVLDLSVLGVFTCITVIVGAYLFSKTA